MVLSALNFLILALTTFPVGLVPAVIGLLYVGWPTITFLQMCRHDDTDARTHFTKAYKCFTYTNTILILVFCVIAVIYGVLMVLEAKINIAITLFISSFIYAVIGIGLNIHFYRVVQTFNSRGEHIKLTH